MPYRVPDPTQAEIQEDYHDDLLDEGPDRYPPAPHRQPTGQQPLTDVSGYSPGAASFAQEEGQPENGAERTGTNRPWSRTRWRTIAIIMIVFVVIILGIIIVSVVKSTHSTHQ